MAKVAQEVLRVERPTGGNDADATPESKAKHKQMKYTTGSDEVRANRVTARRHNSVTIRLEARVRVKRMVASESTIFIVCRERPTGGHQVKAGVEELMEVNLIRGSSPYKSVELRSIFVRGYVFLEFGAPAIAELELGSGWRSRER